jgi:hypothetical protein
MHVTWTRPTPNGIPTGAYFASLDRSPSFASINECIGNRGWVVSIFPKGRDMQQKPVYVHSLRKAQLWVTRYAQAHPVLCGAEVEQMVLKDIYGRPGYSLPRP